MDNEDSFFDMSDEQLEAAFREAKAQEESPETDLENNNEEEQEETVEEIVVEEEELENNTEEDNLKEESDSVDSSEESTEETEEEDSEETAEEETDQTSEEEEDASSDEETEEKDEEQPVQSYKFKANGKDYEFTSEEIVDRFPEIFGQAMDYTKKMQIIKPWRKTIDAIEQAKLDHSDVSLMIDVLKGDKDAIAEVLKRTGVDTLDLDTEEDSKYVAKDYGRDDKSLAIKDIVDEISSDAEYATTQSILSKEWDEASWNVISDKPEMIKLLHADVKSGVYQTLQPLMEKHKVYDKGRRPDIEYYKEAAEEYFNKNAQQEAYKAQQRQKELDASAKKEKLAQVKASSEKRNTVKEASVKRKAAAPSKASATNKGLVDYLDSSDEAFEDWYKSLDI
jgi:hypothetical protein